MPPKRSSRQQAVVSDVFDLNLLFESDDENDEFFGFEAAVENNNTVSSDFSLIFHSSSNDETFLGFQ